MTEAAHDGDAAKRVTAEVWVDCVRVLVQRRGLEWFTGEQLMDMVRVMPEEIRSARKVGDEWRNQRTGQ